MLAELDDHTQIIIEIQVVLQIVFIKRLCLYLCEQVSKNMNMHKQMEGIEEGIEQGRVEGRAEGVIITIDGLIKDGILTIENAAQQLNISESELTAYMQ